MDAETTTALEIKARVNQLIKLGWFYNSKNLKGGRCKVHYAPKRVNGIEQEYVEITATGFLHTLDECSKIALKMATPTEEAR